MMNLASIVWASARSIVDVDATLFVQLGLFLVCFLLLRGLVFKPLIRLADERRAQTTGMREEAKRLDADADGRTKSLARSLQQTKLDAQAEREKIRQLAKQREQEILRLAKEEAARTADAARSSVEAQRAGAEREAVEQAGMLAGGIAARLAGRPL
ncbi:MAG: ATP synthase F0 subunit B [Deltaproteobacteria bacterium]|nr:ATP synthase F0 subunit B [Deltaproteobacteria bacterium]